MTKLEKKLRTALRKLGVDADASVVVAVSGGPDSTALLDALVRLRARHGLPKRIFVAHLNHLLRGEESDGDETFVRQLAERSGLSCFVEQINIADQARKEKKNLEATARRIRYDFLRRVAESCKADAVFTGHTHDDQVETIVMRLLRGSGAEGLRGIYQIRHLSENVKLARPMLDVTRDEVIAYCEHYGVAFRTDSTNLSSDLTRNRIRRELLPMLRTFNPRCDETIARAAKLIADDEDYLQQVSSELYAKAGQGFELDLKPLRESHPAIRRRALRMWLREMRGGLLRIDATHLKAIEILMTEGRSGSVIELPEGWRATREFENIVLTQTRTIACETLEPISLSQETMIEFGGFKFILRRNVPRESFKITKDQDSGRYFALLRECDELNDLRIRARRPGDAYTPAGRRHKIKLKMLMIRHKIPLSQRDTYPLLATADDRIIWGPGLPVAQQFAVSEDDGNESELAIVVAEKKC